MTEVNMASVFKPDDTIVEIGENKYRLVFDMLAFCELEKKYGTVDVVLEMLFGELAEELEPVITYNEAPINIDEVKVDGAPLAMVLSSKKSEKRVAKHSDTLELIWAGMLHDNAIYNDLDEIIGYKVSRRKIASEITFKNYAKLNVKIIEAFIKDLAPNIGVGDEKNVAEAPKEMPAIQLVTPTE